MRVTPGQWPPDNASLEILRMYDETPMPVLPEPTRPPQAALPAAASTGIAEGVDSQQNQPPQGAQQAEAGAQPQDQVVESSDSDSEHAELEHYAARLQAMTPAALTAEKQATEHAAKALEAVTGMGSAKRVLATKLRRLAEEAQNRRPTGEKLSQLDSRYRKALLAHAKTVSTVARLKAELQAAEQTEREQAQEVRDSAARLDALKKDLAATVILHQTEAEIRGQAQQAALASVLSQAGLRAEHIPTVTAALQAALVASTVPEPVNTAVLQQAVPPPDPAAFAEAGQRTVMDAPLHAEQPQGQQPLGPAADVPPTLVSPSQQDTLLQPQTGGEQKPGDQVQEVPNTMDVDAEARKRAASPDQDADPSVMKKRWDDISAATQCSSTLEPVHASFQKLVRLHHTVTGVSAFSLRSVSRNHTQATSEPGVASMRSHIRSSSPASRSALATGATSQWSKRSILQQLTAQGDPGSVTALALALAFALALALALASAAALAPACVSAFRATRKHLCHAFAQRDSVCPLFPAPAQQGLPARLSSARSAKLAQPSRVMSQRRFQHVAHLLTCLALSA
eukprot:79711-Amphidinium_carterae.1